jgi:hypothetical protein
MDEVSKLLELITSDKLEVTDYYVERKYKYSEIPNDKKFTGGSLVLSEKQKFDLHIDAIKSVVR